MLAALTAFLAPYRDGQGAAHATQSSRSSSTSTCRRSTAPRRPSTSLGVLTRSALVDCHARQHRCIADSERPASVIRPALGGRWQRCGAAEAAFLLEISTASCRAHTVRSARRDGPRHRCQWPQEPLTGSSQGVPLAVWLPTRPPRPRRRPRPGGRNRAGVWTRRSMDAGAPLRPSRP
jgi:hypothetical protein